MTKLTNYIRELQANLTHLVRQADYLKESRSRLQTAVRDQREAADEYQAEVEVLKTTLKTTVNDLRAGTAEHIKTIADMQRTINDEVNDHAKTKAEVKIRRDAIASLARDLDEVKEMNRNQQQTIQQLRNANRQTILDLERQVRDRDSWLKEAHQQTDVNAAIIDNLNANITDLNQEIVDLKQAVQFARDEADKLRTDVKKWHETADHWQYEADVASKAIKGLKTRTRDLQRSNEALMENLETNPPRKTTLTLLYFGSVYGTFPITYRTTPQAKMIANNIIKQNPHTWTVARMILDNDIFEREPGPDQPWTNQTQTV